MVEEGKLNRFLSMGAYHLSTQNVDFNIIINHYFPNNKISTLII